MLKSSLIKFDIFPSLIVLTGILFNEDVETLFWLNWKTEFEVEEKEWLVLGEGMLELKL